MPTLTSTQPGSSPDYFRYLSSDAVKTDRLGDPDTFDFTLSGFDDQFVKLNRGAYIIASSDILTDSNGNRVDWFTGYITADPELKYRGVDPHSKQPKFDLVYQAQSDECILSRQTIGIRKPFINMTQGHILKILANTLLPGMFDTSGIQDGLFLARYVVDPTKNFQDIIKEFSQSAVYRFWGRSAKLFFQPQDASTFPPAIAPFTVDGHDKHFTPAQLSIRASQSGIINDAVVLGSTEAQDYVTEEFVGDGSTAQFNLMASVFGIESALLLDDTFSSGQINAATWTVYDTPSNFLQVSNGYLNVLGGTQNGGLDVHLDSANLIPLGGSLSVTHGDFDFIDADQPDGILGIIGGLWTQIPNAALTGCIYGIQVKKTNGVTTLTEIVNGALTANTITVNFNKEYVIRTNFQASRISRSNQSYNYFNSDGAVETVQSAVPLTEDTLAFTTRISEIDSVAGTLDAGFPSVWTSAATVTAGSDPYASYVLVASDNLHCTITDTTISTPFQCTLEASPATKSPTATATVMLTGKVSTTTINPTGTVDFIQNGVTLGSSPVLGGQATLIVTASTITGPTSVTGTFTPSGNTTSGAVSVVQSPSTSSTFTPNFNNFNQQIIGPNEIDSLDGMMPTATVTQSGGIVQKSSTLGTPKYNASNPMLAYFKNSNNFTSTIPQVGDLARLKYRQAGAAIGRVRDNNSVLIESANWGDSGVRSVCRNDLKPQPTTSPECEAAAAAIIAEASRTRFEGSYKFVSDYALTEPLAGMVLPFKNLPADSFEFTDFAEMIYEVKTTLLSISPRETYQYEVSFGKSTDQLLVEQMLASFDKQPDVFTPQDSAEVPAWVNPRAIGLGSAPDLSYLELDHLETGKIWVRTTAPIPAGCAIEVRNTDDSWGSTDGHNLIGRFTSSPFSVPRNAHNEAIFAKLYDERNLCLWSENLTSSSWGSTGGFDGGWGQSPYGYSYGDVGGTATNGNLTIVRKWLVTPDGGTGFVNVVTSNGGAGTIQQTVSVNPAGKPYTGSFSVRGTKGGQVLIQLSNGVDDTAQCAFTLTGGWQRISFAHTFNSTAASGVTLGLEIPSGSAEIQVTNAALEQAAQESTYCRTQSTPYGATSRFASALRVNLPLPPKAPSVKLSFNDGLTPVLSLSLPVVALDVWGFEIRDEDNTTVLEHQDVSEVGPYPAFTMPALSGRGKTYYSYTYNLLGEYSDSFFVSFNLPAPALQLVEVKDRTKMLQWDSTNCTGFLVEIDTVDNTFQNLSVKQTVTDNFFQLSDADFFDQRWIRVTPFDSIGNGTPVVAEHSYLPDPVVSLGTNEVGVIVDPGNGSTPTINVPAQFQKYGTEYQTIAQAMYQANTTG